MSKFQIHVLSSVVCLVVGFAAGQIRPGVAAQQISPLMRPVAQSEPLPNASGPVPENPAIVESASRTTTIPGRTFEATTVSADVSQVEAPPTVNQAPDPVFVPTQQPDIVAEAEPELIEVVASATASETEAPDPQAIPTALVTAKPITYEPPRAEQEAPAPLGVQAVVETSPNVVAYVVDENADGRTFINNETGKLASSAWTRELLKTVSFSECWQKFQVAPHVNRATYVLTKDGKVIAKHFGYMTAAEFADWANSDGQQTVATRGVVTPSVQVGAMPCCRSVRR